MLNNLKGAKLEIGQESTEGKHATVTFEPITTEEQAQDALTSENVTLLRVNTNVPPGAKTDKAGRILSYGWKFDGEYRTEDARNLQVRVYGDIRIPAKQPMDAKPDAAI